VIVALQVLAVLSAVVGGAVIVWYLLGPWR
jgi:hypothetical protein